MSKELSAVSLEFESPREHDPSSSKLDPSVAKLARLLPRWRGQEDKQAAFASTPESTYLSKSSSKDTSVDQGRTDGDDTSVKEVDKLKKFYAPIAAYEGRHLYDTTVQWTEQEERTLVRRVRSWITCHTLSTLTTYSLITKSVLGSPSCFSPYSLTVEISPRRCLTTCLVQNNLKVICDND